MAALATSPDRGASWDLVEVPESTGCVHMTIVPLGDGRIAAFFRRRQADFVYRTESVDGGRTWSAPEPTDVPNNNSSIVAIALARRPRRAALQPDLRRAIATPGASRSTTSSARTTTAAATPTGGVAGDLGRAARAAHALSLGGRRPHLSAPPHRRGRPGTCLSNNALDGRNQELSYPAMVEGADGTLHLAFTFHRRAIKYVRLDRGWIDG